ncbi:MAG: mechanosensitive ion channel [Alphaproteobacteria bacterium]|nr:mechanosensitive ion channel [Alphaproteobacteria bacterium]MDP6812600.1 mechanosensitive ion channel [Alphaproteobacteria bacterium]
MDILGRLGGFGGSAWTAILATLAVIFLGLGARALTLRQTRGFRHGLEQAGGTTLQRLLRLTLRALLDLLGIAAYAIIGFGLTEFLYPSTSLDQAFVFGYLTAVLIIVSVEVVLRFVLAPSAPALRLIRIDDDLARLLHRALFRLTLAASLVWLTTAFLIINGQPPFGVHLTLVLISGLIVIAMAIHIVLQLRLPVSELLRRPTALADPAGRPDGGDAMFSDLRANLVGNWHRFAVGYIIIVATLWSISMLTSGRSVLWPAIGSVAVVAMFPVLDAWLSGVVKNLVGSLLVDHYTPIVNAAADEGAGSAEIKVDHQAIEENARRYTAILRRGLRIALVFLTGLAALQFWNIDLLRLLGAPGAAAIWKAAFDIGVVVLLAYVVWQLIEAAMTRRWSPPVLTPTMTDDDGEAEVVIDAPHGQPEARVHTLLPLIRKFILIVISVMVTMIALASIGVDIGPLLAGAGVVGLAIGFGAQALVRDVVAGVFFLIDDAFRIGEYIEIDTKIRGEVEGISIRSLRLRHHRGAVITLPFGELKQITNHNRDWVIYKMPIRVAPDTDPKKLKKVIKQIGKELMAHPEHGPKMLQPLKSQGVFAIDDDSALIIRVKFMCKPREQFVLRREAYHMIQTAFAENGIQFARRKVEVSTQGSDAEKAAAAAEDLAAQAGSTSGTAAAADAL